jgi:hypothetical protein
VKILFQADADLNEDIVSGVIRRHPEIDFQNAAEAELEGVLDEDVLTLSASEGRVLVTHDWKTMPAHFAEFIQQQKCPGVLVVPQYMSVAAAIEELVMIWEASEAEEYVNRICRLPL